VPVQKYFEDYKLPADIKGFASSTTLKVNLKNVYGNAIYTFGMIQRYFMVA